MSEKKSREEKGKEGENYVIKKVKEYTSLEEAQNENEGFKKNK